MKTFSSAFNELERNSCTIEINGKKMTVEAYNKMHKKTVKRERQEKMIQTLSPYVKKLIKDVKVLKSLAAYYDNGPRQWGHVCTDNIINHPLISKPFNAYRMSAYDMSALMGEIEKIGKKNEKDIFQFIQKLSYKVDDAKMHIQELAKCVEDSRVCDFYKDERCINETGRRLGLSILMTKALLSMSDIENISKELDSIAAKGVDAFDYNGANNKRYYIR